MTGKRIIQLTLCFLFFSVTHLGADVYKLPPVAEPDQYGNLLINRTSEKNNLKAVTFSHWRHRMFYTCRVCHLELDFTMKTNTTEITEKANREGQFCGACHNGKTAFGHSKDNCEKCHNGNVAYGKEKFSELSKFPKAEYGNKVNWSDALSKGIIKPKNTLAGGYRPMPFDRKLELSSEKGDVPPAVFSHATHTQWLDCSNCHPHLFNIKKKTTKHFTMERNVNFEFCGVCHLRTAFPLNDCSRCHPGMKS